MEQIALFDMPAAPRPRRRPAQDRMRLLVRRLDTGMELPAYAQPGDAGLDLCSTLHFTLPAGERRVVPTGIAVAIPAGYAGFVQPRSGLAARAGVALVNSPGLVDSGYRGEIKVVMINLDPADPVEVRRGDRIAQLVVLPVPSVEVHEVDELPESERGAGGFGSTGA